MNPNYHVHVVGFTMRRVEETYFPEYNVTIDPHNSIDIEWDADIGYGHLTINKFDNGYVEVDTEALNEVFLKQVMDAFAEYLIRNAEIY